MKRKDLTEIRTMDVKALGKKARELNAQIEEAGLVMMTKEVKNRHGVKTLRKKRAVVLTVMREKTMAGA